MSVYFAARCVQRVQRAQRLQRAQRAVLRAARGARDKSPRRARGYSEGLRKTGGSGQNYGANENLGVWGVGVNVGRGEADPHTHHTTQLLESTSELLTKLFNIYCIL